MMSIFKTPIKKVRRNTFDLSHDLKASGKMGYLIPVLALDAVPSGHYKLGVENLFRFLPMVAPVMHKVKIKTSFFFVPNRILCPTWEAFILADDSITDEPIAPPTILWQPTGLAAFTVGGYMGLPDMPSTENYIEVSAYPFAAYKRIYEDYYRPQHLEEEDFTPLVPGSSNSDYLDIAVNPPFSTNWALDYFTSALPYPQWGSEAVRIPVGGQNVIYDNPSENAGLFRRTDNGTISAVDPPYIVGLDNAGLPANSMPLYLQDDDTNPAGAYDPNGTLITDPNSAGTIDDLLRANKLQDWLRRTARAGNRYFEQLMSHFPGVKNLDARLQRAEFIGTVRQEVKFSEVLSTAETTSPIGQMAGHGISTNESGMLSYYAQEHGWIIAILTVMPTSAYQDGVARKWLRQDRFDYLWPDFAQIGEQPVYNAELFADLPLGENSNQQRGTWGYQSRYFEYKVEHSRVAGLLRNDLDFWHLGRKFTSLPTLSKPFKQTGFDQGRFSEIFADLEGEHFVFQCYFNIKASLPLPRFGIPAL